MILKAMIICETNRWKRCVREEKNNHDSITNVKEMSSWGNCKLPSNAIALCREMHQNTRDIYHRNAKRFSPLDWRIIHDVLTQEFDSFRLRLGLTLIWHLWSSTFFAKKKTLKYVREFFLCCPAGEIVESIYFGKRKWTLSAWTSMLVANTSSLS